MDYENYTARQIAYQAYAVTQYYKTAPKKLMAVLKFHGEWDMVLNLQNDQNKFVEAKAKFKEHFKLQTAVPAVHHLLQTDV